MLERAGLAQCHTDRAWGPCWPCLGKGGTGSTPGSWDSGSSGAGGAAGLEGMQEQGRGLVLGLVTGLERHCLGDQGMWGVGM